MKLTRAAKRALTKTPIHLFDLMADTYGRGDEPGSINIATSLATRGRIVARFQEVQGLKVDGHPGGETFRSLWALLKPTREEAIDRAVEAADASDGTIYDLGDGGFGWLQAEVDAECDCSGLIAHILGRSRKPARDWELGGVCYWFSTDSIYADATKYGKLFRVIDKPVDGCIAVYPDHDGKQGHTGFIITAADMQGVDCSWSQYHRHGGDAITVRDLSFFKRNSAAIFCVPTWWE